MFFHRLIVAAGLCLIAAGVAKAAVTTTQSATYAFKRCSTCTEVRHPTEQECRAAAYAEAERVGLTRTTGAAVYMCITRFNVIATFRPNPPPAPTPVDCVVSEWGAWSDPPWLACADGMQSRSIVHTRTIVTQPANGGAACPLLVETQAQTQACQATPITCANRVCRLSWTHTGTPAEGFRMVYGQRPDQLPGSVQVTPGTVRTGEVTVPAAGTWYFAVIAFGGGTDSPLSNIESQTAQ